jgi:hypothetical protein
MAVTLKGISQKTALIPFKDAMFSLFQDILYIFFGSQTVYPKFFGS